MYKVRVLARSTHDPQRPTHKYITRNGATKRSLQMFIENVMPTFNNRKSQTPAEIRRTLLQVQTTRIEGGQTVPVPTKLITASAIIKNPWFGRGFVENLRPEIQDVCPELGKLLTEMILKVTGDALEGYGTASVVGMGGELEHA